MTRLLLVELAFVHVVLERGKKIIGKQVGTKRRFIFITSWAFHSSSPGLPSSSSGIFVSSSLMGFAEAVRTTRTVTIQNPVDIFTFFFWQEDGERLVCVSANG